MLKGAVTPDAVVPESRVWLAMGDTARAIVWLDNTLREHALHVLEVMNACHQSQQTGRRIAVETSFKWPIFG